MCRHDTILTQANNGRYSFFVTRRGRRSASPMRCPQAGQTRERAETGAPQFAQTATAVESAGGDPGCGVAPLLPAAGGGSAGAVVAAVGAGGAPASRRAGGR